MTQATQAPPHPLTVVEHHLNKPRFLDAVSKALPQNTISVPHLIRSAISCVKKNPRLMEADPITIMEGVVQVAELGLELSGPLGQAFLVPYWNSRRKVNEAVLQIGYKGFMTLAYRSPLVRGISAQVVFKGDEFSYGYGTSNYIVHKPSAENTDFSDEAVTHAYALVTLSAGHHEFKVLSQAQIRAHMERYCRKDNQGQFSDAWRGSWQAMAMKTCVRQVCKFTPLELLQRAAALDEYAEQGLATTLANGIERSTQEKLLDLKERLGVDAPDGGIQPDQAAEIKLLVDALNWEPHIVLSYLLEWEAGDVGELTQAQAQEVIDGLKAKLQQKPE